MSALSSLCQLVLPGKGRRRVARPPAKPADRYARTLRPVEALVNDLAYCPVERRTTLHCFLRGGGRICWDCRTYTKTRPLTSTPEVDGG